jgi:hypothetical protein
MANTDVTLFHTDGAYVPSAPSVPVVSGDTISFSTSDGSSAIAFFSPDAISVLSPKPANPLTIAGKTAFSFTSSSAGAYSIFFAADPSSSPANFPQGSSQTLLLEIAGADAPPFDNPMTTGHKSSDI